MDQPGLVAICVLIVDDDPSFRETASELLLTRGFAVAGHAADDQEAVAAAGRLRPDGVLLDIHLGEVDGCDVVSQISPGGAGPRVLLTSADRVASNDELAQRCGAVGFVAKEELATADLARYFAG
jgi:CheY-like chemotaxis protein